MVDYHIKEAEESELGDVSMAKGFISVEDFEKEIKEYKQLVFKGQMVDFIVAFILGAALNNVAKSISENLIMPFVSFTLTSTGQNWEQLLWQPIPGLKMEVGKFFAACISFILIAVILFLVWFVMKGVAGPESLPLSMRLRKLWRWIFPWRLVRVEEDKKEPEPAKGEETTLNITTLP